jgi:hypothetical protein
MNDQSYDTLSQTRNGLAWLATDLVLASFTNLVQRESWDKRVLINVGKVVGQHLVKDYQSISVL